VGRFSTCAAAFCALFVSSGVAAAATISSFPTKEGKIVLVINGPIAAGDADQVAALIKASNDAGKFVSAVRLNSPGGNLAEGVKLADIIRTAKIATVVPNGSTCASACFVAFAAGTEKFASNNASVGVHGASEKDGSETPESSAATIAMARIAKELGVPATILGKMVVTPPTEMIWLSPNDLRAMGATMTGKPAQTTPTTAGAAPPAAAQQLPSPNSTSGLQANAGATPPTWETFTRTAITQSGQQNNGRPSLFRNCQPELKLCTTGVFFKDDKGHSMMARSAENIDGTIVSREVCSFNDFGDVRKCVDWDKATIHTDMKDSAGNWHLVDDK
jgi:hypothetical protein